MKIALTVLLGLGTVAVSLILLICVIKLMHVIITSAEKKHDSVKSVSPPAVPAGAPDENVPDHGTLVAVISAAIAEQLGTDVSAVRILSIKKI